MGPLFVVFFIKEHGDIKKITDYGPMTKTLGVTGGIGSGKTAVCRLFEALSARVFYADVEAKLKFLLMHQCTKCFIIRAAYIELFARNTKAKKKQQ